MIVRGFSMFDVAEGPSVSGTGICTKLSLCNACLIVGQPLHSVMSAIEIVAYFGGGTPYEIVMASIGDLGSTEPLLFGGTAPQELVQ